MGPGRAMTWGACWLAAGVLGACHHPTQERTRAEEPAVARSAPAAAGAGSAADAGDDEFPPVVEEAKLDAKAINQDLPALVAGAAARHKRVFFYFGATWCGPCRLLKTAFERANNRGTFAPWIMVRVNVDELPPGPVLGVDFDEIPFFIKLDSHGKPAGTLKGRALGKVTSPASVDASLKRFLGS